MDSAGCCSICYTAQYHDEVFTFYVHVELLQSVMFCIRNDLSLEQERGRGAPSPHVAPGESHRTILCYHRRQFHYYIACY